MSNLQPATATLAGIEFKVGNLRDYLTAPADQLTPMQRSLVMRYKNSRQFREWFYEGTDRDPDELLRSVGLLSEAI